MNRLLLLTLSWLCLSLSAQTPTAQKSQMRDSVALQGVTVSGKSKAQRLREGALTANAIDIASVTASVSSLSRLVDRTAGIRVREEGGMGSDFDLSINGLSGNSVRYFVDGVPLDVKGQGVTLANLPVSLVDRIEIYKGVVPTYLGSDALGGAVNIVTRRKHTNFIDASYSIGSYHTHQVDLNAQLLLPGGFTLRPTLGLNYSKNDYMMHGVEVWNEGERRYEETSRRRFHDGYRSLLAQVEAGWTAVAWADALLLSVARTATCKEIQTGQVQSRVVGAAERHGNAWSLSATYSKLSMLRGLVDVSAAFSHTWDHTVTTDTAYRQYDWNGDYIVSSRNELTGRARMLRHYKRPLTVVRADLNCHLGEHHTLNLNYSLNRTGNNRFDDVDATFEPANDVLAKHILSLAYSLSACRDRLSATLFAKDYINHLHIEQKDIPSVTGSREVMGSSTKSHQGYGLGARFSVLTQLAVKASYERSVRLPLAHELLGNGTTVYANVALKPEQSNNVNLGLFGTFTRGDHLLDYELGGFLRHVENYIQPQVSEKEGTMQYVNQPAVRIKGVEGELRYRWRSRLSAVANLSWQDARDRHRFKSDGKPSVTYNNHVPNRPWLFASAQARYKMDGGWLPRGASLDIGADYQWVHWFFLTWEGYGSLDTKARIPTKHVVGASATYSWHHQRYSVSLLCDNLLDATLYDNYKLQKPGRQLALKFRFLLASGQ